MILVETLMSLFLLLMATAMNLELVRRAQYEALFQHSCFRFVRARALGQGARPSRRIVLHQTEEALGYRKARSIFIGLHLEEERVKEGLLARVHYRFPAFLGFPYRRQTKHHFELTKKCRFFF